MDRAEKRLELSRGKRGREKQVEKFARERR